MRNKYLKVFGKSTLSMLCLFLLVVLIGQAGLAAIQYFTVGRSGVDIFGTECEYIDVLQYTKSFIPESIQNAVKQQGYTLKMVDDVSGNMLGKTNPLTKKITVQAVGEDGPIQNNTFAAIFIHEYGHAVSYTYGHLSESKEFKAVYKQGLTQESPLFGDYALSNTSEYFAESFMAYIVARDQLKVWHPETAAYFDEFFAAANETNPRVGLLTYEARSFDYMFERILPGVPLMVLVAILFGLFMVLKQHKLDKLNLTPPVSTTER